MAFGDVDGFLDKPMRKITLYDGATTPLSFEITLIGGDVSADNLHRFLNEKVDVAGGGKHQGTAHGNPVYPTLTLTARIDKFVSDTVDEGTILDFWHGRTGTLYAAATNAPPAGAVASREPYRHVLVEYEKTTAITSNIGFESCVLTGLSFADESQGEFEMSLECKGRVFADDVLLCGRVGASETVPDWAAIS